MKRKRKKRSRCELVKRADDLVEAYRRLRKFKVISTPMLLRAAEAYDEASLGFLARACRRLAAYATEQRRQKK